MSSDVQELLENDLTCAICQDIYINPLILNCSHSFCKFCVFRWLSKKTGCPTCRMTVSFQAENLALRNIINRMVQKSSPQFQTNRITSVDQRLKDEEEQEKDGTSKMFSQKDPSIFSGLRPRTSRYRMIEGENSGSRTNQIRLSTVFSSGDGNYLDDVLPTLTPPLSRPDLGILRHFYLGTRGWLDTDDEESDDEDFDADDDNDDDDDDDDDNHNANQDNSDADEDNGNDDEDLDIDVMEEGGIEEYLYASEDDDENDVTFEIDSDSLDNASVSSVESVHISSDESFVDLDVTGNTDAEDSSDEEEDDDDDDDDEDNDNNPDDEDSTGTSESSSSSSSSEEDTDVDDDDDSQVEEIFRSFSYSLPQNNSDNETTSDDSTEEYAIDDSMSDISDRYSDESTIEYGTSDESVYSSR